MICVFECQWPWVMCQLLSSQKCMQFKAALDIVQAETLTQSEKSGWTFSDILGFSH